MRKVLFGEGYLSVCPKKAMGAEARRSEGRVVWVLRRKFQPGNPAGATGPEAGAWFVQGQEGACVAFVVRRQAE